MDTLKKSPGYVLVCVVLFTVLQFNSNKLSAQTQTTGSDSTSNAEIKIKEKQAEQLSILCPHYPVAVPGSGGINTSFNLAYKQWISDYPNEYSEYKKIFNYK